MRPRPEQSNGDLPGDLAWFLEVYGVFGLPYSAGPMSGIVDRRAELYGPRQAYLDKHWPKGLDREAPEAVWADLDEYHLSLARAQLEAAASG